MDLKARIIAIYLPQFHPIPENDQWHGTGFTEWTNVAKAKPLFKGHYQPRLPADLGFYDLRVPETRAAQARMAKEHGIDGFLYWHYWFGHGRRILERPFSEVLESGQPDFPFCLGWANASWTGVWYGMKDWELLKQEYPGREDYERHFYAVLPAFRDRRYVTVGGKPLFFIYNPPDLPDARAYTDLWRELAVKEGLGGIHFVASMFGVRESKTAGAFDALALLDPFAFMPKRISAFSKLCEKFLPVLAGRAKERWRRRPTLYPYADLVSFLEERELPGREYPVVMPNFDNTARCGRSGTVLQNSTPELFEKMLADAMKKVKEREPDRRIIFIEAWNEWAEGNHLEPDQRYGRGYLEAVKRAVHT